MRATPTFLVFQRHDIRKKLTLFVILRLDYLGVWLCSIFIDIAVIIPVCSIWVKYDVIGCDMCILRLHLQLFHLLLLFFGNGDCCCRFAQVYGGCKDNFSFIITQIHHTESLVQALMFILDGECLINFS